MNDRARVEYVMAKTGLSRRTVQAMAARGEIPGAAKFGKLWTFDRIKLARWIRDKEQECLRTSINAVAFTTPAFRFPGPSGASRLWERTYHNAFEPWRFCGEWFAPHPDILAEIERIGGSHAA